MKRINREALDAADPVAKFLINRNITPIGLALIWLLITMVINSIAALSSGAFFPLDTPEEVALLEDWVWWVWNVGFGPVLAGYYLWSSGAIVPVFDELQSTGILEVHEADVKKILPAWQKNWRFILSVVGMLLVGFLFYITRDDFSGVAALSMQFKFSASFTYAILAYFTIMLILNLNLNVWSIQNIIRGKVLNINPLHPDQCGGLKPLSNYSIKVVYLNAVFAFLVSVVSYRFYQQGNVIVVGVVAIFYFALAAYSFFAPLSSVHDEMRKAKNELMEKLGKQFWQDYNLAHEAIDGKLEELQAGVAKIKELQELYKLTESFPIWPFDTATLRRFFGALTSPIIPAMAGILIDFLTGLIFTS